MGGIPMMNSNSTAPRSEPNNVAIQENMIMQLNTYIYDYFLKRGYHDCARALVQDESAPVNTTPQTKSNRRESEVNGIDGDAMQTDSKDDLKSKIPDDLPRPNLNGDIQQTSFLLDWFNMFWDVFWAQRKKGKSSDAATYLSHTQNLLRLQNQRQNQLYRHSQMIPNQFNMRLPPNGMMPANLQKSMLQGHSQNMNPQQLAQLQKVQQAQMMQHQMQREHSDMEMNGHRPQSPSSLENAPSPSKRPRLDGGQANGHQMTPNGRAPSQGMPGQPNQQTNAMLMQAGVNPRALTPNQLHAFQQQSPAVQNKSLQVYNHNLAMHHSRSAMNNQGMPNGLMNTGVIPNQGDMMPQLHDGQGLVPMQEYYPGNGQVQMRPGMQTPGGQNGGNHALQDYQMQLMLLEQQNKRRLMLARNEQQQDTLAREGQPGMQPNMPAGTSPQGSRNGASPNPNEQMKRGTPKLPQTGLPGSPNVGDAMAQGRGSPASINFPGGQMPTDMGGAAFFNGMKNMPEGIAPNGMRPPSSNPAFSGPQMGQPMEAMARQPPGAAGRIPSGNWQPGPQGQPMVPQQSQPGQPAGTPQERNAMPPPQAPANAGPGGRTQAPSPQPSAAAPPTPQQASKPAPKKKDTKESTRKRPTKKVTANAANTAATPSSEAEPPPTPTPSTPITPVHPNSFNKAAPSATSQPTSAPVPQPMGQQQPQQSQPPAAQPPQQPPQDPNHAFEGINPTDHTGDYSTIDFNLEGGDLLEFDFDTFLNNTDDTGTFAFGQGLAYPPDGVEAGAGENM